MTSAGFIRNRRDNNLCKKMQSRVARTIKHARALGLFSYKNGDFRPRNPLEYKHKDPDQEDELEEEFEENEPDERDSTKASSLKFAKEYEENEPDERGSTKASSPKFAQEYEQKESMQGRGSTKARTKFAEKSIGAKK